MKAQLISTGGQANRQTESERRPMLPPIVDRDPGDENDYDAAADERRPLGLRREPEYRAA